MASTRSASRMRAASLGLMPMPTSPAYSGWRLSKVSWKRKAQPTGSCQFSAKRCSAAQASASQPLPPAMTKGRWRQQQAAQVAQRAGRGPGLRRAPRAAAPARRWAWSACPRAVPAPPGPGGPASRCGRPAPRTRAGGRRRAPRHPLGHAQRAGAEHLAVVDLLEGLAVALVAGHLADEQHHRRAVLEGRVHADAGIGGAGPRVTKHTPGRPSACPARRP
jgi:hypothetical protein